MRFAAALLLAAPIAAHAFGFKDLEVGKPINTSGDVGSRLSCRTQPCVYFASPRDISDRRGSLLTIGGALALSVLVDTRDGVVDDVFVSFSASAFDTVQQGFAEKYPGLKCANSVVQNRMGASFDQTECTAESADAFLRLKRRSSKVDEGSLHIITKTRLEESAKERSKNKRDL